MKQNYTASENSYRLNMAKASEFCAMGRLSSPSAYIIFIFFFTLITSDFSAQIVQTFTYTGAVQTFVVPSCVTSITVDARGGAGGAGGKFTTSTATVTTGGNGGKVQGVLSVTPGQTLYIYVGGIGTAGNNTTGGAGGFNGGGLGPNSTGSGGGGGGGGASDVRQGGTTLGNRILVAAGGGGGGGSGSASSIGGNGGDGGGTTGMTGANGSSAYGIGGGGGTQLAGGVMGGNQPGSSNGALGLGGDGSGPLSNGSGGGGGGGYYGGGGGGTNLCSGCTTSSGAGGGGSGYTDPSATSVVHTPGTQTGNGAITFTYNFGGGGMMSASASNTMVCTGTSVSLTASSASSYTWLPVGSFAGSNSASITHTPTSTTAYTVQGTSSSTCVSTVILTITVNTAVPSLTVTSSTNQVCLGKTATLTAAGANTYTWTNGVSNGVSFYPSATTAYTVSGQNGCGTTTAVSTISVTPLPITAVSSSTAICTNKTATLSVTAAANSYTFQPGNVTGTSPNLIVNPQVNTIYTITASDGTCSGVANLTLQADPVPTITSSSSSSIVCPGGTINLTASGGINYTWTPVNLNGSSITVSPTASTLYNVVGDNSFGCLGNSSQVIVAGTQPTLALSSSNSTICNGNSATLTVSGADTYAWTGGPTTTVYVVSPTQVSTYTIVGTNSSSGCTDTKTITVDVFTPLITITGNTVVCEGNAVNLTASGAGGYLWTPGNLPFTSIAVTPTSNTIYTVSGVGTSGSLNCPATTTVQVVVNPNPTVTTVSTPTAICPKETATITANGAGTYTWAGTSTTVVNPSIQVSSPNVSILVYTVTGASALGCLSSISVPVTIYACVGIDQLTAGNRQLVIYPNPNNGDFTIQSEAEINLTVMNELGQLVKQIRLDESNNYKTSLVHLSNGIYFLVNDTMSQKIIVNK